IRGAVAVRPCETIFQALLPVSENILLIMTCSIVTRITRPKRHTSRERFVRPRLAHAVSLNSDPALAATVDYSSAWALMFMGLSAVPIWWRWLLRRPHCPRRGQSVHLLARWGTFGPPI